MRLGEPGGGAYITSIVMVQAVGRKVYPGKDGEREGVMRRGKSCEEQHIDDDVSSKTSRNCRHIVEGIRNK